MLFHNFYFCLFYINLILCHCNNVLKKLEKKENKFIEKNLIMFYFLILSLVPNFPNKKKQWFIKIFYIYLQT